MRLMRCVALTSSVLLLSFFVLRPHSQEPRFYYPAPIAVR